MENTFDIFDIFMIMLIFLFAIGAAIIPKRCLIVFFVEICQKKL
ncbi:MAG: hypothetical protein ACI9L6_001225 [Flavobacterium sp.]|jgi:hypothetical protein